jgi:hypothetical protein
LRCDLNHFSRLLRWVAGGERSRARGPRQSKWSKGAPPGVKCTLGNGGGKK